MEKFKVSIWIDYFINGVDQSGTGSDYIAEFSTELEAEKFVKRLVKSVKKED